MSDDRGVRCNASIPKAQKQGGRDELSVSKPSVGFKRAGANQLVNGPMSPMSVPPCGSKATARLCNRKRDLEVVHSKSVGLRNLVPVANENQQGIGVQKGNESRCRPATVTVLQQRRDERAQPQEACF